MRDVSLRRLASYASLGVAVVLVAVKLAAWIVTGSVALLTSAVDALVDMAASLATLLGVRYAERPPDRDHRFGHGKGEAVAGFTQSAFLAGAAIVLAFQSTERLIFPAPVKQLGLGLGVMIASLLAAAALVAMQTWVVRHINSDRSGSGPLSHGRSSYPCCPRGTRRDLVHRLGTRRSRFRAGHLRLHAVEQPGNRSRCAEAATRP